MGRALAKILSGKSYRPAINQAIARCNLCDSRGHAAGAA